MSVECSVVFADVTGSTELYEKRGDAFAQQVLERLLSALSGVVETNHGTVIKYIGDEVMARFPDADSALQATLDMQETTARMYTETQCLIKVGLHHGPVIESADDIFGDAVNVTARMVGIARGGQIITTSDLVNALSPAYRQMCQMFDRAQVKGKQETIDIYTVVWEEEDDVTTIHQRVYDAPADEEQILLLTFRNDSFEISSKRSFTIGRGVQCDLTVPVDSASREHARIGFRNGKFILADQSTNGTYVRTEDGNSVYLRREEMVLWGEGVVCLGADFDEESSHLYYECVE